MFPFDLINALPAPASISIYIALAVIFVYILYKAYTRYQQKLKDEPVWYNMRTLHGYFVKTKPLKPIVIPGTKLLPSKYGMEYSLSFWINIDNWNYNFGKVKHIMHKGSEDISSCNPGIFLHPTKNQLIVRVDTTETASTYKVYKNRNLREGSTIKSSVDVREQDCKNECSTDETCNSFTLDHLANQCTFFKNDVVVDDDKVFTTQESVNTYSKQKSMNPKYYGEHELNSLMPCDIVDLPLQRWNHIVVVLWNRNLDVYLNGKLARSCALKSVPQINNGSLYLFKDGGFSGDLANLRYYNRAINTDEVYSIYKKGPETANMIRKLLPNISFKLSAEAGTEEDA
jgi:hypothetical protein